MTATDRPAAPEAPRAATLGVAAAPDAGGTTARVLRVFALAVGASTVLFLALLTGVIAEQWNASATWWNAGALATLVLCAAALAAAALDGRPNRIQAAAGAMAVLYLAIIVLQPAASLAPVPNGASPWITNLAAAAAAATSIAVRPALGWVHLGLVGVAVAYVRFACGAEQSWIAALQNAAQVVSFSSLYLLLGLALVRAGRTADAAIGRARRERSAEASRRARRDAVDRINALIHDRVLATLLLAGRATSPGGRRIAADSARDALDALERQRGDDEPRMTPRALAWNVQGLVRDLDPEAQFGYDLPTPAEPREAAGTQAPPGGELPAEIADAITAATLEALRNSLRHAGRPGVATTRAVHLEAGADRVVATVLDDGAGFDVAGVDEARLGIASSIRGRMAAIGGTAQLVSVVGKGTRVTLTWDRAIAAAGEAARARAGAERPWRVRRRVSPLDMDFWIGPPPGALLGGTVDATGAGDAPDADAVPAEHAARSAARGSLRPSSAEANAVTRVRAARLSRRIQREPLLVAAALQVAANIVLAVTTGETGHPGAPDWWGIGALAASAVAAASVALPSGTPLPKRAAIATIAATSLMTVCMNLTVPPTAGYAAWHLGANTLVLTALAVRARIGFAWLGMLGMIALTALWPWPEPLGPVGVVRLFDRNAATLLVGTIAALALKRTIGRTLAIERVRDAQAADEAAAAAGLEERERVLRRFESSALPVLREIARGGESDASRRLAWLATEAELRDRIRARSLDVEPLRGAVQRARARGARVVVLDDTGGLGPSGALGDAIDWAADRLDAERAGEVTVRLRATASGSVLTVVGDARHEREIAAAAP